MPSEEVVLEALVRWRACAQQQQQQQQQQQCPNDKLCAERQCCLCSRREEKDDDGEEEEEHGDRGSEGARGRSDHQMSGQESQEQLWRSLLDCVRFANMSTDYLEHRGMELAQQAACAHLRRCVLETLSLRLPRAGRNGREGGACVVGGKGHTMLHRGGSGPSVNFCQRLRVGLEFKAHAGSVEAVACYQVPPYVPHTSLNVYRVYVRTCVMCEVKCNIPTPAAHPPNTRAHRTR